MTTMEETGTSSEGGMVRRVEGSEILQASPEHRAHLRGKSFWRNVHHALRGRYWWVIALGLVCAGGSSWAAWRFIKPQYTSEGLVQIKAMKETIDGSGQMLQNFDTFMASQKTIITSHRIIDEALRMPVWKAMGREVPPSPDQWFMKHMNVDIRPRNEYIRITVDDEDPVLAATATTAMINAYSAYYTNLEADQSRQRTATLEQQRTTLNSRINDLNQQIRDKVKDYGTTRLDIFLTAEKEEVLRLQTALKEVQQAIVTAKAEHAVATGPATAPASQPTVETLLATTQPIEVTPEVISMTDGAMRAYIIQRDQAQDELDRVKRTRPAGSDAFVAATEEVKKAQARVDSYALTYRQVHAATMFPGGVVGVPGIKGPSLEKLRAGEEGLSTLLGEEQKKMVGLGNLESEVKVLETEQVELQDEYDSLSKILEQARVSEPLSRRFFVVSTGDVALSPSKTLRNKLTPVAGVAGLLLPAAVMLLLSMRKQPYRYADETVSDSAMSHVPLLGMLPDVRGKRDAEMMHAAAHGIHQLRVMLSAKAGGEARKSYLVTSATEGEGKTNLTVALGMSFSAAKRKTLIVDFDFIGRRLSRGFHLEEEEGLSEVMQDGKLGRRTRPLGGMLWVLPAGRVQAFDVCGVTTEAIRNVLEVANQEFETVLIDTGPVLGSLESVSAAQEVDGVILAISRGQRPALVEHALRRLHAVGAVVEGAVFNRAKVADFHSSPYASSQTSIPFAAALEQRQEMPPLGDFGPLVDAVSVLMAPRTSAAA